VTELLKDGEPFEQAASSAAEGEPAAGSLDPSGDKTGDVTTGDAQLD
jgi:hypothetical protein